MQDRGSEDRDPGWEGRDGAWGLAWRWADGPLRSAAMSGCIATGGLGRGIRCFISVQNPCLLLFSPQVTLFVLCLQDYARVPRGRPCPTVPRSPLNKQLFGPPEHCALPPFLPAFVHSHNRFFKIKTVYIWASLVAQWLGIRLPMQGTRV